MHPSKQGSHQTGGRPASSRTFLRIVGTLWLVVLLAILVAATMAPYAGRLADVVLHHTLHRDWSQLTLRVDQPFFDLSAPASTVKSYYSALYRGDAAAMQRLTHGTLQAQLQQRLSHAAAESENTTYRSYVHTQRRATHAAEVTEKFHLFWHHGLRFRLQRHAVEWHIVALELVR